VTDPRRVLFTTVPIHGQLLPLLPLARAVANAGHHPVMAVSDAMAHLVDGRPVCVYGPDIDVLLQENRRRTAAGSIADYDAVAELACTTAQAAWDLWRQQRCERPDAGRTILFCFTAALRGGGDLGALETVRHQADDAAMAIPTASDYGINDDALAVLLKQHHTVCQRRRMPARSHPHR
jgi:hypothetical protein